MAKVLQEAPLTTRSTRSNLPKGLHWRSLDREVHLGYRKGARGGVWLVRWRVAARYRQAPLGPADDVLRAGTLSYDAAAKAAREFVERARLEAAAAAAGPPLTVRSAVESYIANRDARDSRRAGRAKRSDAASRLARYVVGKPASGRRKAIAAVPLADVALHALAEKDISHWRERLPDALKATTKRRLMNDLKAALNAAYARDRERLPATLSGVIKHALRTLEREDETEPVARDNQILSDTEIARLLRAAREVDAEGNWEGDLFRLIIVLAATGARFSQVARLRVRDFQRKECRLLIPVSRKGRGGPKSASVTVPIGADVVDALAPAVAGRTKDAPLLERWRHVQEEGAIAWRRDSRGMWFSASELTRPWNAIRERAGLHEVVVYSLRHSSIVKGIRANLPIRLVAALHDTSTAMIERHYSKWITDGLEEMARAAIVPLVPARDGENVVRMRGDA